MANSVTLDKLGITVVLNRLARQSEGEARLLYGRLMSSWGQRPDRQRVSVKVSDAELGILKNLDLPPSYLDADVLASGWWVTYQHPRRPQLEVRVRTKNKPPKRRTFTVGGKRVRLVAVKVTRARKATKETNRMARSKAATKSKKVDQDELDELEGLEDLDDLEDLEDEEEPDDEDVEEDEEEDEEPAPKRTRAKKGTAKKPAAKSTRSRRKAAESEDEEEEDEEDEDEEPAPKRRSSKTKTASKPTAKGKGTAASKSKANGGSKKNNLPATRELPAGKLGPQDIAEMVGGGCDARYVRIFLRDSEDYEKEEGARWAFSKGEARTLVRELKAKRKGE